MNKEIIILRGLPGSGKSRYARQLAQSFPEIFVRVNRDDIRIMLGIEGGLGTPDQEAIVTAIEKAQAQAALDLDKTPIIDAMNLNNMFVKEWFKMGKAIFLDFQNPVGACIENDAKREVGHVGEGVIRKIAKRYGIKEDGSLKPPPAQPEPFVFKKVPAWSGNKTDAVILDVDGTVADHSEVRSPYDTSRYHLDSAHGDVISIAQSLSDTYRVIVTTGRSEEFRDVTKKWLIENCVPFDRIIMRKAGDERNDAIVKHDLFWEFIAPEFNVIAAIDDRARVLRAWRAMGITTLAAGDTDNNDF